MTKKTNRDSVNYPKKCNILYKGPISVVFDEDLEKAMNKIGYRRWASGISFSDGIRDIGFEQFEVNKEAK